MSVHLNDLSKVYLQNVFESSHNSDDEPKMKKKHKKHDREDDNGEENNDDEPRWQNSDGDNKWYEPGEDVAAPKKKKVTKESFSNWRNDLIEVIEPERLPSKMKEGNVDNYTGKNKCVTINPEVKEQVQILESVELSEEYVDQIVNLASQYFYSEGYDEKSIKIIAEGMGHDEFVDFIFDIGNTFFLDEATAHQGELLTTKNKARKNPQTSARPGASTPVSHTPSKPKEEKPEEKKTSPGQLSIDYNKKPIPPGQQRVKDAVGNVVKKATSRKAKRAVGDAVKGAANTAARTALSAWQGHKAAMKKKGEGGSVAQQIGAGLGAAAGAFFKKGNEHLKNSYEFADWLYYIVSEGCDISEWTINDLYKQYKLNEAVYGNINEKAESEQQQKLFGLALSVKRGKTSRSEVSQAVLDIVDKMSEKEIRKYAGTPHKGIPKKKVEEELDPTTPQQFAARRQLTNAQKKVTAADQAALKQKQKQTQVEEYLDERQVPVTRQAGDFRYSGKTGEEKAERRARVLSNSPDPKKRRQANTIRKTIKTVADRDTARASSDAMKKLYKKQQQAKHDVVHQLLQAKKGNVNAGYEPDGNLVDESTPTSLFYKLQKAGKRGSSTAKAQKRSDADLETQKNLKMKKQQTMQRQEREPEEDHPSLSARERNPNLR